MQRVLVDFRDREQPARAVVAAGLHRGGLRDGEQDAVRVVRRGLHGDEVVVLRLNSEGQTAVFVIAPRLRGILHGDRLILRAVFQHKLIGRLRLTDREAERQVLKAPHLADRAFEHHQIGAALAGRGGGVVVSVVAPVPVRVCAVDRHADEAVALVLDIGVDARPAPVVVILFADHERERLVVDHDRSERGDIRRLHGLARYDPHRLGHVIRPGEFILRKREAKLHLSDRIHVHAGIGPPVGAKCVAFGAARRNR